MKKINIFLLCICIVNLCSRRLDKDNNLKNLELNCIISRFAKYDDYNNVDENTFWVIRNSNEWRDNRTKYIPTVNLVPAIIPI